MSTTATIRTASQTRCMTGRMSADLDIVPVRGDETDDLLNMLFDEKGSPLLDEMDASKDGLPVLDSNEIDPDEFLNFLTQQLNSDVSPSCDQLTSDLIPSCGQLTVKSYTCDTDHRYSRLPLGGSSSTDGTESPPADQSTGSLPFCQREESSPWGDVSPSHPDPSPPPWGSPAPTDPASQLISFDSSQLQDNDFFNSLLSTGVDDISLDLGLTDDCLLDTDDAKSCATSSSLMTSLPFTMQEASSIHSQQLNYTDLLLSDEEKTLLIQEGIILPTDLPLTKREESALKSVRRKIRNKVSAKESRKRKQSYVDGLEKRVKVCTAHNLQLQRKLTNLEQQNMSLMSQLKKVQLLITATTKRPAQAGTCIMVILLSFALLILPNLNPLFSSRPTAIHDLGGKRIPIAGRSRSLLHDVGEAPLETVNVVPLTTAMYPQDRALPPRRPGSAGAVVRGEEIGAHNGTEEDDNGGRPWRGKTRESGEERRMSVDVMEGKASSSDDRKEGPPRRGEDGREAERMREDGDAMERDDREDGTQLGGPVDEASQDEDVRTADREDEGRTQLRGPEDDNTRTKDHEWQEKAEDSDSDDELHDLRDKNDL